MDAPAGHDALAALAWLVEAGADEAVLDEPVDRFVARPPAPALPSEASQPGASPLPARPAVVQPRQAAAQPVAPAAAPASDHIGQAMEIAGGCNSLEELKAALEAFEGCALKRTAKHTVFADGTPAGRIMVIGEAPGAEEDRQGKPFVGRAGQLLDKMLAAIGLSRQASVYITNVLNWRPPGNRDPSPDEAGTCLPFLRRHIELAAPEIIVLLGATAARHVTGRTDGIMRMRGQWMEYFAAGKMVPVMPTLHPAYLLRQPAHKKLAWRDLQAIENKIKSLGLLEPVESSR